MITAREAREIAGPTDEEIINQVVEEACEAIRLKAEDKGRKVCLRCGFWANEGYSGTEKYKKACQKLKDLGFEVEFFYEERQFVDMGTIIKW